MQTLEKDSDVISLPTPEAKQRVVTNTAEDSYAAVRYNAIKHGVLSKLTVLAHEDHAEYAGLLAALIAEHQPAGMTEQILVEELAVIVWRKRRVLLAEGANINQGMRGVARNAVGVVPAAAPFAFGLSGDGTDLRDVMDMTPADVAESQREAARDYDATRKAAAILRRGAANAYDKALRALIPDSRDWWHKHVKEEVYPATAKGLGDFISEHLEPLCIQTQREVQHHEAIKSQALGEGLQVHRLEKLNRYETHLDRKFERTLAMILKMKELRGK